MELDNMTMKRFLKQLAICYTFSLKKKKLQLTRWNAPINYAASTPLSAKACSFLTYTQAKDGKNVHPWFSISTS